MFVLDVSNYAYIFKVDSVLALEAASGISFFDDDYLIMGDWSKGFAVVDISDPLDVSVVQRVDTPGWGYVGANFEDYLYFCDSYSLITYNLYGQGIDERGSNELIPNNARLKSIYPNPFNSITKIVFQLPKRQSVKLSIYNIIGEEIATLADDNFDAGTYMMNFNAEGLTSGIYFASLKTEKNHQTEKLILIK
jgi:hypothetical protein